MASSERNPNMERITITVPKVMIIKIQACVDAGLYASASEIARDAFRRLLETQLQNMEGQSLSSVQVNGRTYTIIDKKTKAKAEGD